MRYAQAQNNQKVGLLKKGLIVNVYEEQKGWSRINYNDELTGWSISTALERISTEEPVQEQEQPEQGAAASQVTREEFDALVARVAALEADRDMAE